ncbi:MAG: cytochrome C biogenesis protein [Chloroflexi bacterium HGW-Chloroflexi-5]|jgi:hypothetical protein|nr:MAG: cytochrome C biogenesis protein [Chloroflexi bacterium HGW-Chloroflexi-5]
MNNSPFLKLEIFCPEENVNEILEALAGAHVGEIGNYDHCSTISQVQGSYRPLEGANPAFGEVGKLFLGTESKIEINCREEHLVEAIQAVRLVHPYEEPVINVIPLVNHHYGATI